MSLPHSRRPRSDRNVHSTSPFRQSASEEITATHSGSTSTQAATNQAQKLLTSALAPRHRFAQGLFRVYRLSVRGSREDRNFFRIYARTNSNNQWFMVTLTEDLLPIPEESLGLYIGPLRSGAPDVKASPSDLGFAHLGALRVVRNGTANESSIQQLFSQLDVRTKRGTLDRVEVPRGDESAILQRLNQTGWFSLVQYDSDSIYSTDQLDCEFIRLT